MALVRYTFEHRWLSLEDHVLTVGITHEGCVEVGEIISVELPRLGAAVDAGERCVNLRSSNVEKVVQAPLKGEVIEVNSEVLAHPSLVNEDPEGAGWMIRIRLPKKDGFDGYLMAWDYQKFVAERRGSMD